MIIDRLKAIYKYLTEDDSMHWSNREYSFNILLCKSTDQNFPWNYQTWVEDIKPIIATLLAQSAACQNAGIRVLKYQKQPDSDYFKELKLGRLRWDDKSHEKWTIQKEDASVFFKQFELWTPIWTQCEKANCPPDIFISIENENKLEGCNQVQFDAFVVVAIAADLKLDCKDTIIELSKKIGSKVTVSQTRKWDKGKKDKDKNWTFYNWIQYTWTNGIYRKQNLHNFNLDDVVFEPYWQIVYKALAE